MTVVPYGRNYRVFCPWCGDEREARNEDANSLRIKIQRKCGVCSKHGLDAVELVELAG